MNRRTLHFGRIASLLALGGIALVAQSTQTGTLTVNVKDANGAPLSGVRVELKSDKLAGSRTGVTDAAGVFRAPLLPPGNYTGTVSKDGFRTAGVTALVPLGGSTSADVALKTMQTEGVTVTVVATASKIDKTDVAVKENYSQEDILKLPVGRTLAGITQLAPGVTTGAGGRAAIGGSATYENKFLVNGADVNDNYFGTDVGLFIEDAIDETQILTNNVSAEYGRFTGGVVNAITKRGGNQFEGSFRANMTNQNWNAVLPNIAEYKKNPASTTPTIAAVDYRKSVVSKVNTVYTVTVGGPILKDKLWFFFAGRSAKTEASNSLPFSGVQYVQKNEETRYEANLTWQINSDHRILGSYLNREVKNKNRAPLVNNTADPAGLSNRRDPLSLKTIAYDGVLSPSLNLNVTYTEKLQKITTTSPGSPGNNGGKAFWQSPVFGPLGDLYNNHYFGNDPEERNNNSLKAVLSWYFNAAGSHEFKVGAEQFKEINIGTNQQSPTGFNIDASDVDATDIKNVKYYFYADGSAYLEDWTKAPGGKFTSTYSSLFVNDNWTINNHFNASIGFRYEKWKGSQGNSLYAVPTFSDVTPRLGLTYDPKGDGAWQLNATYATYAGKANAAIVTAGTYVGNPAVYYYFYTGPDSEGVTASSTTAGFRRSDYDSTPFYVSDATKNTKLRNGFKAPLTLEYTVGMKHKVNETTNFTMLYIHRNQTRMFEDYVGDFGHVNIEGNDFSIIEWGNVADNEATRVYQALQGTWETSREMAGGRLYWRGNVTFSKLEGNYEGDGGNSPGGGTVIGNYPKAQPNSLATAYGRLANDEPVRVKTQALWSRPIGNSSLSLGFNFDYASGKPYTLSRTANTLTTVPEYVDAAGNTYARVYGRRGQARFNDVYFLDFSAQWDGKIGPKSGATSRLGYFIKLTAFNVLNNIQQATWNVTSNTARINPAPNSTNDVYIANDRFGRATTPANFVGNRQMQVEVGLKF